MIDPYNLYDIGLVNHEWDIFNRRKIDLKFIILFDKSNQNSLFNASTLSLF